MQAEIPPHKSYYVLLKVKQGGWRYPILENVSRAIKAYLMPRIYHKSN
jgi:hypothetical protein